MAGTQGAQGRAAEGPSRRRGAALAAALAAALLAGCAADTATSLVPVAAVPSGAPRVTGVQSPADREHARLVAAFGGEYQAPNARAMLAEITSRLVAATDRPDEAYRITILDSPVVNAFALPSGRLYVTRGLLALANDTAEIAGVLAHEIAHVTLRHAHARSELEARSALVSRVVSDVLRDPNASALVASQSRVSIASFSRAQELEADQVGVRTLAKAGFDVYGAARFLTSLGRAGGGEGGQASPDMLSTHPSTPERVALATTAARRVVGAPGLGERDRARYLQAVDGVSFGDNPTDGVIRGRTFVHTRFGIAFEAPPGLSLENTSQAVLGSSPDGNRRILFDALAPQEGQSLEALLQSTWSDGVEAGSLESTTVNGLPAALAVARGKDWAFRLAAIRAGQNTYRLVYAVRSLGPEAERAFQGALASVRQVSPEEARTIKPLRMQVVTATDGDTPERLAERMTLTDRPLERFLTLNGLEPGAALQAGERYKIVVE
jgi:predicted Zn-dependent protease